MTTIVKSLACALLCASIALVDAAPAMAQPSVGARPAIAGTTVIEKNFELVQFRGSRRGRSNSYRRGNGGNIALGIGAAIIGGLALSAAGRAEHRSSHGSDWERCARTYRSFDSDTGTYTGYDGVRRTCPYLR